MRKRDELTNPNGCTSRALPHEMMFVLLSRDEDAPGTIRDWIARRIKSGKNQPGDALMTEAEQCAQTMEAERAAIRQELATPSDEWAFCSGCNYMGRVVRCTEPGSVYVSGCKCNAGLPPAYPVAV